MKRCAAGLLVLLAAGQVSAQCAVVATTPATFGSVSSTLVRTDIQSTSTANAGLECSGSLLSLLRSNDYFKATFSSTTSSTGLVGPTGDVISYTLYANNSTSYPITRGVAYDFARNGIIDALGLLGGSTPKTVPLYMKTIIGANVAAGLYRETLTVAWDIDYCYGIGLGNACLGRQQLALSTSLTISLTVTNDCQITTPNIVFGTAPVVSGFATVNQSINLSCTKGSSYTVGLNDGLNVSGGRRRMKSPANNYLAYDIYKSGGSVRWGSTSGARRASGDADVNPGQGAGGGAGVGAQIFHYNAKVYTDQATPPAATYTDSVVLDVLF
ncbi:spore coat protein U domain-containing protein [Pseudomonas sp. MAFF212427]|uniref:Spore coat protein U domain-containing protein n=2 Tax=Pseudomonas brassicae TaxID=2708063 RepID=A0A6B3NMD7_9PSED|nr:spore coat protein U domain-containing protein [Pseudomonas brassicae]